MTKTLIHVYPRQISSCMCHYASELLSSFTKLWIQSSVFFATTIFFKNRLFLMFYPASSSVQ